MKPLIARKVRIKNIVVASAVIILIASFVLIDFHRVEKDFQGLRVDLMRVRFQSISRPSPLVVRFDSDNLAVMDLTSGKILETLRYRTISKVDYQTTLGDNMIVFLNGTTSYHNKRVHGGEIELRSWLGFTKYMHVNCAGYVEEGRFPESEEN